MKKIIGALMLCFSFSIFSQENYKLISYIPYDGEIQNLMNLYEWLKSIEIDESDYNQLGEIYSALENQNERYYETYQRLLFEAYLLFTNNPVIKKYILSYISENNYQDEFSLTLLRLYQGEQEKYETNNKEYYKIKTVGGLVDEQINLFNMNEVTVFDGGLGLMLFDNDWAIISINDENKKTNENNLSLVYGGGTNSIAVYLKEIKDISFDDFKKIEIDGDFYKKKFSDYQIFELPKEGVLSRAGADNIYIGIGNDEDAAFPDIMNFSSIMYLYSSEKKTGYIIDYFMNISIKNNNYKIKNALFNHIYFQNLLSFIN